MEHKPPPFRLTTLSNLQDTREALAAFHNTQESDATIWNSLKSTAICLRIHQFLYKALYGTQKVGEYWKHISRHETHQTCTSCEVTELMKHSLIHCHESLPNTIWPLVILALRMPGSYRSLHLM